MLACPWRSWSCSVECRRTGLFCFSVRNPPPAPPPQDKSRLQSHCFSYRLVNSVALLAGSGLSSNLPPAICPVTSVPFRIPICIVRNGQAPVCRRPAGLPPSQRGRALPGPARGAGSSLPSLCPVPAGCTALLSFAFILLAVPHPVITAVRVSPENSRLWLTAGWGAEGTGSLQPAHPWVKRTDF